MWVPLVENGEYCGAGADYFVQKHLDHLLRQSPAIDTLLLACTHYPLLLPKIRQFIPDTISVLSQGPIVADRLVDYLARHPDLAAQCTQTGDRQFLTTDSTAEFDRQASQFFGQSVQSERANELI